MNILLIHNNYAIISGEELIIDRIANLLTKKDHQVIRLFEESLSHNANFLSKGVAFFSGLYSNQGVMKVRHWIRTYRPDIVQVQNLYPYLSPWILPAIQQEGIPVVMRCANYRLVCPNGLFLSHGRVCEYCMGGREYWCVLRNCENHFFKSLGYALRNLVSRTARLYNNNITLYYTQTKFQKRKLIEGGYPPERIEVIPNMVNILNSENNTQPGNYVAFVGRGSPEKGIYALLNATESLPDINFCLAGDFCRMPEVQKKELGNVEFRGYLKGPNLSDFYRNCRILVMPSTCYEGFPGVIIEAMIHGKPVVCSRIGGLPEIVDEGINGLLFEPGNSEDLAAKVNWLWSRPELCMEMGQAGRAKVLKEYSPDRYYERLIRVYRRALELHGSSS